MLNKEKKGLQLRSKFALVLLVLTFGTGITNAANYPHEGIAPNGLYDLSDAKSNLLIDNEVMGSEGIAFLQKIMGSGSFFASLLMLQSKSPEIAKAAQFTTLFNEVHLVNRNLILVVEQMQKTNALLAQCLRQKQAADG